jgi:hypothetical protein
MVLHGLEGSIKAHSNLPGATPDPRLTFPFAHGNLQPPLISVVLNVEHCAESFHRRQLEESKHEFHLKVRHRVPGEENLGTVRDVFDRVRQELGKLDIGRDLRGV